MIESAILYLFLGAFAGVGAGLFGIGGGLIIVPVLIFTFTAQGMPQAVVTHAALATSLATIVLTSISSVIAHHRRGGVRFEILKPLSVGIALGATSGALVADTLTGRTLQLMLGCFATAMSVYMALDIKPKRATSLPRVPELSGVGVFIGGASSLFGIGGGTLTVPYLTYRGVEMRQAVGTSAACGLPIAFFAASSYIFAGLDAQDMPQYSLGYIYMPAFIFVGTASSQFAKLGAKWAHSLPQKRLKQIFALFLLAIGSRFLLINLLGG